MECNMRLKPITILENGNQLMAWWANNRGRGSDNCSLAVVKCGIERAGNAASQTDVIATTRTSSWRGDVNLSRAVCEQLGLNESTRKHILNNKSHR